MNDPYFKLRPPLETPQDEICSCTEVKPIKLMVALGYNPIYCIDCNLEVAPESLGINEQLVELLARWRSLHDSIDRLWLDSGEYEGWAKEQLEDIHSPVNQRGLALRADIETVRRCYYWYFQDQSVDGYEPISRCPHCHQPMRLYSGGIFKQLICEDCSIISVGESS